jgi:pyrimidine operon attenuation protein/uracil phosphoribosyltransferase
MDAAAIGRALTRMAHQIVEQNPGSQPLAFVGIRTRGGPLAQRLADKVNAICNQDYPVGSIDIGMHRDDLALRDGLPVVGASEIPFDVTDRVIVLVDDVLFTGRTIRAAMDEIADFGRPSKIQLAILVDRGHRELPIRPDYVGKNLPTQRSQKVRVRMAEQDETDEVVIES